MGSFVGSAASVSLPAVVYASVLRNMFSCFVCGPVSPPPSQEIKNALAASGVRSVS